MSYKTEFQSNNADLQAILDAVNNLPEAPSVKSGTITTASNSMSLTVPELTGAENFVLVLYDDSTRVVTTWQVVSLLKVGSNTVVTHSDGSGNVNVRDQSVESVSVDSSGKITLANVYFAEATYFYVIW